MRIRGRGSLGIVLEVVLVVCGVLLALALNEWRQVRSDRHLVARVEASVRAEIEQNRREVAAALERRAEMVAQLKAGERLLGGVSVTGASVDWASPASVEAFVRAEAARQGQQLPPDPRFRAVGEGSYEMTMGKEVVRLRLEGDVLRLYGRGNIMLGPATILNTAWDTLQVTRAALHMPYEVVAAMARLHHQQRWYQEVVSTGLALLYFSNVYGSGLEAETAGFLPVLEDMVRGEQTLLASYQEMLALLDGKGGAGGEPGPGPSGE
jgi:hypothetical protein